MARIRALIESGHGAEVRTAHGAWRLVVAVYSDQTVGTIRAEGARHLGRFTVIEADGIAAVRSTRHGPASAAEEGSDSTEGSAMEPRNPSGELSHLPKTA